ncbi:CAP domain-containing protein [Rhodobacteraceae bacterium N5(2021)]|uniref:CAP domain-containing protein n=1 Tax=Gymnodinialimonas phycosphaerae TaxID=2841589 RepID=A0A975TUD4_9RHOB|nr:CAP domain-containing protein [Gymnodinialimonas phycosphaerae]MBY4895258.1 CAP domain-containing protein [Gymnodinialimonas phycosphaerae]
MKIHLASGLLALSLALAACAPTGVGGVQRLSLGESVDIAAVGARLSTLRAGQGLARPLGHSAALQAAAQAHVDDMAQSGNLSHTGSNGSTLTSRLRAAGYSACFAAENIAAGQANTAEVFEDWMGSGGHRRNILAAEATQFGFARAGGYSVLVLGRSC